MIRIGPAGIPLSCKGRTNKDGVIYVKKVLDLNAMEIQLIRG
ncbi:MAG: endonuclease IV, partial [Thermoprotei archaeon]